MPPIKMKTRYKGLIIGSILGTLIFIIALIYGWEEFVNDSIGLVSMIWLYMAIFYGIICFLIGWAIEIARMYSSKKKYLKANSIENYKSK